MRACPESALDKLGFDRILQALTERTATASGRRAVLQIGPLGNGRAAAEAMRAVVELREILRLDDALPWGQVPEVAEIIQRARPVGSVLEGADFRAVGAVAERAARMAGFFKSREEAAPLLHARMHLLEPVEPERARLWLLGVRADRAAEIHARLGPLRIELETPATEAAVEGFTKIIVAFLEDTVETAPDAATRSESCAK